MTHANNTEIQSCEESTECICHQFNSPPTFQYHVVDGNAPSIYYWLWAIGIICVMLVIISTVPRVFKLKHEAIRIRDLMNNALPPFSFTICTILTAFPFVGVICNFITLLAPITYIIFIFLLNIYQGLVLYVFARLVIMYLGSYNSAIKALSSDSVTPIKFYGSPPLGCCFKPWMKPKRMQPDDFRVIYHMVKQYIVIAPFAVFCSLFFENNYSIYENRLIVKILAAVQILTSVICLYATQCLLAGSKQLLRKYEIVGKFKVIQLGVMSMSIPPAIISLLPNGTTGINFVYNDLIMNDAWSAFIAVVSYTMLSFGFQRYFGIQTAMDAMENANNQSYTSCGEETDDDNDDEQMIGKFAGGDGSKHIETNGIKFTTQ